jgi:hypothetical protein
MLLYPSRNASIQGTERSIQRGICCLTLPHHAADVECPHELSAIVVAADSDPAVLNPGLDVRVPSLQEVRGGTTWFLGRTPVSSHTRLSIRRRRTCTWQRFPRRLTERGEKRWITLHAAGNQTPKFFAHIIRHSRHAAKIYGGFLTLSFHFHETSVHKCTYMYI